MKQQIQQIRNYFKSKILKGDYLITTHSDCSIGITIDKEFVFNLWIANGSQYFGLFNSDNHINTVSLDFTNDEKKEAYSKIEPTLKELAIKRNLAQLEQIKKTIS
jgi:hypothetical protein